MKKILTFGLAASALLVGSVQAQAATMTVDIDKFDTEPQYLSLVGPVLPPEFPIVSDYDISGSSDSILGNYRRLESTITFDEFGRFADTEVAQSFIDANGTLSISAADGVIAHTAVIWDAMDQDENTPEFGLNSDLIGEGSSPQGLSLDILTADLLSSDVAMDDTLDPADPIPSLMFTVMGNNGATATISKEIASLGNVFFDYDDFDVDTGTSAGVFNDVKSIQLDVTGPRSFDASFDNFTAIKDETTTPEPAAVVGLLLSLGCGALSKKKKQA